MTRTGTPSRQIGAGSITALVLAIAALLLLAWAAFFQPVALILSIAAVLIAGASLVNGRRHRTVGTWVSLAAVVLGIVGLAIVLGAIFT